MPKRLLKTSIEVDPSTLDEALASQVEILEKKVKSLERRLAGRDKKIKNMQDGLDISKPRRDRIRIIANDLFTELEDAGWVEIDRYYELVLKLKYSRSCSSVIPGRNGTPYWNRGCSLLMNSARYWT